MGLKEYFKEIVFNNQPSRLDVDDAFPESTAYAFSGRLLCNRFLRSYWSNQVAKVEPMCNLILSNQAVASLFAVL